MSNEDERWIHRSDCAQPGTLRLFVFNQEKKMFKNLWWPLAFALCAAASGGAGAADQPPKAVSNVGAVTAAGADGIVRINRLGLGCNDSTCIWIQGQNFSKQCRVVMFAPDWSGFRMDVPPEQTKCESSTVITLRIPEEVRRRYGAVNLSVVNNRTGPWIKWSEPRYIQIPRLPPVVDPQPEAGNAANIYVAESQAGTSSGRTYASARATASLVAGDYVAGNTIHLCGKITSPISYQGGGSAGKPVTLVFEPGAVMTSAAWKAAAINGGGHSWIVLDGGTNGVIQNTANGTSGAYDNSLPSIGADFSGSSNSIIRNLKISNIYVRTGNSLDYTLGAKENRCIKWNSGSNNLITNNVTHDCTMNVYAGGSNDANITVTHNTGHHMAVHFLVGPGNTGSTLSNVTYAYNKFGDPAPAWDSPRGVEMFHIDGFHYFCQANSTCSGLDIHNNHFHGNFGLKYTAQIFTEHNRGIHSKHRIYNNLVLGVTDTQSSGGQIAAQLGADGLVANNTIIGTNLSGTGMYITDSTNLCLLNNIVSTFNYAMAAQGVTFAAGCLNNNLYSNFSNGFQADGVGKGDLPAWQTATGQEAASSDKPPNLSALGVPNNGSPVIGSGANLSSRGILSLNSDKNGKVRPAAGPWDMGALMH